MNTLLVVYSYHHNTQKVAEVFAKFFGAEIITPQQIIPDKLQEYDLVGFGAGIDSGKHYKPLLDLADNLPQVTEKKAFIFSTSAIQGEEKIAKDHTELRQKLQVKGYQIIGEFSCKGYNTNSFLKVFGGMNKGHPNEQDLKAAEEFAQELKQKG